jgi:hypothetical protein
MWRRGSIVALAVFAVAVPSAAPAAAPSLAFTTFVHTDLPLGHVTWTGREFLYLSENLGRIQASDADGSHLRPWAALDQGGEEMRCSVPANLYWPDGVYCHTPDNRIIRFARDGSSFFQLARLPGGDNSDGSLAFDTSGQFGYALLVATGGSSTRGGVVYGIRKDGRVQTIGPYPGPGGADEIAVAPPKFGSASGWLLLSIDQDHVEGRVLAINRKGTVKTIATGLGEGLNPIAVIAAPGKSPRTAGSPAPGLYVADTLSQNVFYAPLPAGIATGTVLVGTELTARFWAIAPSTSGGFQVVPVATNLPVQDWNLEGSTYVAASP